MDATADNPRRVVVPSTAGSRRRAWWLLSVVLIALACLLHWGGYLLIASDPLPQHLDAAVVLQGSIAGEMARISRAVDLLQQGVAQRILLSVPRESYWGESIPPVARHYLEGKYGKAVADRVEFCETGPNVNSTGEEARAVGECLREQGWHSIVVVTSNYHSRRAGILWRRAIKTVDPSVRLWIDAAADPTFQPRGWWRNRLYAKTWLMESTKLVWDWLFE
jgi:uncharacterized SAM-binding protein YcdF (DUF218 family)